MVNRATKLRWRRRFKRKQQQVEELGTQAEKQLERHFFRRLNRFEGVRRFVFAWLLLFVFLISGVVIQTRALSRFYQTLVPAQGGVFTEGVYGSFTNANPIYATGAVDSSVARLVFSSLMRYDAQNRLVGDLADSIDVDTTGSEYTVLLKSDLFWHDGQPLTAKDVVFTYRTIQQPDARSPYFANWKNVKIEAKSKQKVVFTLPHALASFPHSLTNGIVPEHKLGGVDPASLRSASFNTIAPIGSGPFKWDDIAVEGDTPETREERIGLIANSGYYEGAPNIERFIIRAFHNKDALRSAIERKEISAAAGLQEVSPAMRNSLSLVEYNVPLAGEVLLFMKNSQEPLGDKRVRQALTMATNQAAIIESLGYPVVVADAPLLKSHIGYNEKLTQLAPNLKKARNTLDKAGWKIKDGVRQKNGKKLSITISTLDTGVYPGMVEQLQGQWAKIGVVVVPDLQSDTALQSAIASHSYETLLYGITVGSDPDVYAYWHSSQADPRSANRLNFAEYKSSQADASLEAGRSRISDKLRATKYKPFLEAWREDAPAIAFYQPRYLYVTQTKLFGFDPTVFNTPIDRYANVENWAIRQDRVDIY